MTPDTELSARAARQPCPRHTGLADVTGVVHVHTTYSDGGDDIKTVIDKAREAGLDFIVISDHDRLTARDEGWEGWHDGVLVIVAAEVTTRNGHCLALNIDCLKNYKKTPASQFLEDIAAQGGYAFIAHPSGYVKRQFTLKVKSWDTWDAANFTGIEIWAYMHDWFADVGLLNLKRAVDAPDSHITGPHQTVLDLWDRIGQTRRVVGIGALDSHSRRFPFNWLPFSFMTVFPLEHIFRTIRTHLLVEPFTGDAGVDIPKALSAMAQGHCYVDYLPHGDATGLCFTAQRGDDELAAMGDEIDGDGWTLCVQVPLVAQLQLLCNGQVIEETTGTKIAVASPGPGVYRVEAKIDGKPWVFTNPIYMR